MVAADRNTDRAHFVTWTCEDLHDASGFTGRAERFTSKVEASLQNPDLFGGILDPPLLNIDTRIHMFGRHTGGGCGCYVGCSQNKMYQASN